MFVLKKTLGFMLSPLSLIIFFLFAGLILLLFTSKKSLGKIIITASAAFLAFSSFTPTADILISSLKKQYAPFDMLNTEIHGKDIKLVVVLSAGNSPDKSIPVSARVGYDTLSRLIEGIRIYRVIHGSKLLLSGGNSLGQGSSAEYMAQLAKELGVSSKDIIVETNSLDTHDQAVFIKDIVKDMPFILVTNAAHMPRSMALFKKLGMDPVAAPSVSVEKLLFSYTPSPFFPSSVNLQKVEAAFHEYTGMIWGKLRNQI